MKGVTMGFQRFEGTKYRTGRIGEPMISIWTIGQISFNIDAKRRFNLDDFTHAVLFFDQDTRSIGILLTNDPNEIGALKLIIPKTGGRAISAKKFLNFHEIDYSVSKTYPLEYDREANLYVFKID
jgi:hypothetical protein